MFELLEVLNSMAFFRRTESPLLDPYNDNWWLQGYNRLHYEKIKGIRLSNNPVYKKLKRTIPEAIKKHIPNSLKRKIRRIY